MARNIFLRFSACVYCSPLRASAACPEICPSFVTPSTITATSGAEPRYLLVATPQSS